jgi:serine/threonine protein kinase
MGAEPGVRADPAVASAPRTLGKFALLEQIGEGGMARIFLARARGLGGFEKWVVVKQILPRLAEDADFISRFFQEARLTATLDHPNIATVYEVDRDGNDYFYSMEYVRGRDLQKLMRRAKQRERMLRLDEIVTIVTGLCAGLHHAHTRLGPDGRPLGIVHRDVSPSNVLLSYEGAVKLADFGVAKARTGMVSTVAGTLRGKIAYMSPEQCRGEALDRRSDVYSVGALLWELLTGRRLHEGESEIGLVRQIADGEAPSPATLRPDSTAALDRIVLKALTREPARRYSSAHALQIDLEEYAREHKLAVSARTLASLMHELFAQEYERERQEHQLAPTVPFRLEPVDEAVPADFKTPPTATLAPVVGVEHEPGDAPTITARSWRGLALGLAAGIVLGGGGLYLALGSDPPPAPAPTSEPVSTTTPSAAAPPSRSVERATSSIAPPPVAPPVAAAEPDVQTPAASKPKPAPESRRRKAKRRRAPSSRRRELNLDSALPPGLE